MNVRYSWFVEKGGIKKKEKEKNLLNYISHVL